MEEVCMFCSCFNEKRKKKEQVINAECKDPLYNWEKWLRERRKMCESLAKRLKRPKSHLLMNLSEENRKVIEEKMLFVNKKNFKYCDKYRGHPQWYVLPPRLFQPNLDVPIIQAILSKQEKKEMVSLTYIETPIYVLKEKDILPRARNMFVQWQKGAYRQAALKKIKKKMKFLEPHRPNLSELIVIGNKIGPKKLENLDEYGCTAPCKENVVCKKSQCLDPSVMAQPELHSEYSETSFYSAHKTETVETPAIVLLVNGREITSTVIKAGKLTIRIVFSSNEIPKIPLKRSLLFENKGRITLRIMLRKREKFITFRDILPARRKLSPYYFNKSELILLPSQTINLPIWFKPTHTGFFVETWTMNTRPEIWNDEFVLSIIFQGIVYKEEYVQKSESVQNLLENRMRCTLVQDIISEIVDSTNYEQSQYQTYTYSEKDLFESMNIEKWGAIKRRKYLFNEHIVNKLKQLYYKVRSPEDPLHWNYSVKTLKEATRKRDVLDFINNLYKECTRVKERAAVLKQMYDTPHHKLNVRRGKSTMSPELVITEEQDAKPETEAVPEQDSDMHRASDHQINYSAFDKLNVLLEKLKRPVMIQNMEKREKHATVYYVLRFYITKMSKDLGDYNGNFVPNLLEMKTKRIKNTSHLPERLIYERFDPVWVKRTGRVKHKSETNLVFYSMKPKPKNLEGIPIQNFEERHRAYFSKTQEKKRKDTTVKPSASKMVKKAPSILEVVEGFDPYADVSELITSQSITPSQKQLTLEDYVPQNILFPINEEVSSTKTYEEKYLIVYTNLCAAIDAMVNTIETVSEIKMPLPTLGELATCKVVNTDAYKLIAPKRSLDKIDTSDEYYQYLIDTYLGDPKTQDYFIRGKITQILDKTQEYSKQTIPASRASIVSVIKSWKSQEYLVMEMKEDSIRSVGIQTSETEDFLPPISNILIRGDIVSQAYAQKEEEEEEDDEGDDESHEKFYFVDSKEYVPQKPTDDRSSNKVYYDDIW